MSGYAKAYGVMAIFNGIEERDYSIAQGDPDADIVIDIHHAQVVKHPHDAVPRPATEEERAAVGWTW